MNLLLALVVWNGFLLLLAADVEAAFTPNTELFVVLLVRVNLLLMVFNLIPIGPLDGHYILPHFLPPAAAEAYRRYNARYGVYALLGLILLGVLGVPVFSYVMSIATALLPLITFVPMS